ncbi:hypothetical protein MMC14_008633 [Varicellaria rhodocarpa]|nr:hypothetical protein [Varicellaria rhodocarpa]
MFSSATQLSQAPGRRLSQQLSQHLPRKKLGSIDCISPRPKTSATRASKVPAKKVLDWLYSMDTDDPHPDQSGEMPKVIDPLTPQPSNIVAAAERPYASAPSSIVSSIVSSVSEPPESSVSANVGVANYRDILKCHKVHIDPFNTMSMPPDLKNFAHEIIEKRRDNQEVSAEDISFLQKRLARAVNSDEGITREILAITGLSEIPCNMSGIQKGASLPFNRKAVPNNPEYPFRHISAPTPDIQYGFDPENFTFQQLTLMGHRRLSAIARPSSAGYFPFCVSEIKSASRGGTHYVGENQAAGSGAHCVNSIGMLLDYISDDWLETRKKDSIVFSIVMDAQHASVWVHWPQERSTYVSTQLEDYAWIDAKKVLAFIHALRGISYWAMGTRLLIIQAALNSASKLVTAWDADDEDKDNDKLGKKRSSDIGGSQGSKKKRKSRR